MRIFYLLGMSISLLGSGAFAIQPTDINYCAKGKTLWGATYSTYTVRCSDGRKREITAWENRKKWCVGTTKNNCTTDQLKTAQQVCSTIK